MFFTNINQSFLWVTDYFDLLAIRFVVQLCMADHAYVIISHPYSFLSPEKEKIVCSGTGGIIYKNLREIIDCRCSILNY